MMTQKKNLIGPSVPTDIKSSDSAINASKSFQENGVVKENHSSESNFFLPSTDWDEELRILEEKQLTVPPSGTYGLCKEKIRLCSESETTRIQCVEQSNSLSTIDLSHGNPTNAFISESRSESQTPAVLSEGS